jgi:hypothetical protein
VRPKVYSCNIICFNEIDNIRMASRPSSMVKMDLVMHGVKIVGHPPGASRSGESFNPTAKEWRRGHQASWLSPIPPADVNSGAAMAEIIDESRPPESNTP